MKILATIIVILLAGLGVFYFGPFHHQTSTPDPHVDLVAPANAPAASEDPPLIDALQSSLRDKESEARISSLLAAGANANVTDKTGRPALSLAVRNNDLDALAALLKAGADPNQRDKEMQWTPLMYASFQTARIPMESPPRIPRRSLFRLC